MVPRGGGSAGEKRGMKGSAAARRPPRTLVKEEATACTAWAGPRRSTKRAFDSYASQSINVDFNNATDGQLLEVDACLLDVDVRRIVEQFWRLDQDKTGTLEYECVIELSLNLQKALSRR